MSKNKVSISDFLTVEEVVAAIKLFREASDSTFAEKCDEQIIAPVISRINAKLGQENHPRYLAYLVQYVFMELNVKQRVVAIEQEPQERIFVNERASRANGFHGFSRN